MPKGGIPGFGRFKPVYKGFYKVIPTVSPGFTLLFLVILARKVSSLGLYPRGLSRMSER